MDPSTLSPEQQKYFFGEINRLASLIRYCIYEHGFSKPEPANVPEKLMLTVSELSEALEFARSDRWELFYHESGKPDGFGIELADAIIRILDMCAAMDIDIAALLAIKMAYNESRPHKHGRLF